MKKTTRKKSSPKAAKPSAPQSASIEIRLYPHVAHVHVNGEEAPEHRRMIDVSFNAEDFAAEKANHFKSYVTVARFDAVGNPIK